jgi:hypothetical protein
MHLGGMTGLVETSLPQQSCSQWPVRLVLCVAYINKPLGARNNLQGYSVHYEGLLNKHLSGSMKIPS